MARRGYPAEFRKRVIELVEGGKKVAEVAADLGISQQTIYAWRRQARIDAGLEAGLSTSEEAEPAAARRRIREPETELAIRRPATERRRRAPAASTQPEGEGSYAFGVDSRVNAAQSDLQGRVHLGPVRVDQEPRDGQAQAIRAPQA